MGNCCCTPPPDPPPRGACCYIDNLGSLRCADNVLEIDCFTNYNQSSFSSEALCGEKIICSREGDSISPVTIYKGDDFYIVKSNDYYYYWHASLSEENVVYAGDQLKNQLYNVHRLQGNLKNQILFDRSQYAEKRGQLGIDGIWSTNKDSNRSFSFASLRSDKSLYIHRHNEFSYPAYIYRTSPDTQSNLFGDSLGSQLIVYDQDLRANNQAWTDSKFKDFAMTSIEGKELCGAIAAIYDETHFDASKRGKVFTVGSYKNGACPNNIVDISNTPDGIGGDIINHDFNFVNNRIENINSIENASGIISNNKAFLVLQKDGKAVSFGDRDYGGDIAYSGGYKFINSGRGATSSLTADQGNVLFDVGIHAQSKPQEYDGKTDKAFSLIDNAYSDIYRSYEHFFTYNSQSKEGSALGVSKFEGYYNNNINAQNILVVLNRLAALEDIFIGIEKVIPLHNNFLLLGSSTYRVGGKHINGHYREFNIPEGASSVVKAFDSNSYIIILWDNGKCSIELLNKYLYGGNKSYFNNISLDSTSSSDSLVTNKVIENVKDIFSAEECYAILYDDNKLEICFKEGNDSGYLPTVSIDPYFTVSNITGSDGVYKLYTFENVIDCRLGSTFSFPFDQKQTVFESKKTQTISVFRKTDTIVLGRYSNTGHYASDTENFKVVSDKLFPIAFNENYGSVFNPLGEEKSLYQRNLNAQAPADSAYELISDIINDAYNYPITFTPGQEDYAFEACATRCNTTLLQCNHLTGETSIPTDGVYSSDFPNSVVNSPSDCFANSETCCGIYVRNTDGRLLYFNTINTPDKNLCTPPESVLINGKTYTSDNASIYSDFIDGYPIGYNRYTNLLQAHCYKSTNDLFPNLKAPFARGPNDTALYPKTGTGDKIIISPSIFGGEVTPDGKCFLLLDYFQIDGSHSFDYNYEYRARVSGRAYTYKSDGTFVDTISTVFEANLPIEDMVEPISGRAILDMRVPHSGPLYEFDFVRFYVYSFYLYKVDNTIANLNDKIISNISQSKGTYRLGPDDPYWRTPFIDNKYIKRAKFERDANNYFFGTLYDLKYGNTSPIQVDIYRGDFYDV